MATTRAAEATVQEGRIRVPLREALAILLPFVRGRLLDQARGVAPVVAYLAGFQILCLRIPIGDAAPIALGIGAAVLGLVFFMEGLRLGLMPFAETIGNALPRRAGLPVIAALAFVLGVGATLAEPAIGALRAAGASVDPAKAPLLHAALNASSAGLVAVVGAGVGIATVLGILRILGNWSLKVLILPLVVILLLLTGWASLDPDLSDLVGLAWDSGAITTGPITVPIVLALGLGVGKAAGRSESGMAGFGIVTLASLVPIAAVLGLGFWLDASGAASGAAAAAAAGREAAPDASSPGTIGLAVALASRAIVPLCAFMLVVQVVLLRARIARGDEVALGLSFVLIGMILFNLGLLEGLTPLGEQVGSLAPGAFTTIEAGTPPRPVGPMYGPVPGTLVVVAFAFLLGYGATVAEPALNALGAQVHEITVGAFRRPVLVHSVALGVGLGMALGVLKLLLNVPLVCLLAPIYLLLIPLSLLSSEEFVNIGWDSAGVTTGPVTVPLVTALGLGIGGNVPGVVEGFGILSLASAGPILTVLLVGLLARRRGAAPRLEARG